MSINVLSEEKVGQRKPLTPTRPLKMAVLLGMVYIFYSLLYIHFSGDLAARFADSVEQMRAIERYKGFAFVIITGVLLSILAWLLFARIAFQERRAADHVNALLIAERRAVGGLYAASIAHDMRNMLMLIQNGLEIARRHPVHNEEDLAGIKNAQEAFDVTLRLSNRLMHIGRQEIPGEEEECDLVALAKDCIELGAGHHSLKHSTINLDAPDTLYKKINPIMFQQMMLNLLINAGEATNGRGVINVEMKRVKGKITLAVHDNGPGIPAEKRAKVFEPIYSEKPTGAGLGLVSTKVFTELYKGHITILDSFLGGACFRIELPNAT